MMRSRLLVAAGAAWDGGPAKNQGGIESRNSSLTPISDPASSALIRPVHLPIDGGGVPA